MMEKLMKSYAQNMTPIPGKIDKSFLLLSNTIFFALISAVSGRPQR
jgi:hypothetical protein